MSEVHAQPKDDPGRELLEVLAEEFSARRRRGEVPSVSEYARKHPQLAVEIRRLFPTLELLVVAANDAEAETKPSTQGRELGNYRLIRELGRGGMGVVYEAEQRTLGRHVALKVLPFATTHDPHHLERFKLEAQAAARLQHPNIVPVIGLGEHDGVHYYTMHFIDGDGLDVVLHDLRHLRDDDGARVSADDVRPVVRQLCSSEFGSQVGGDSDAALPTARASASSPPTGAPLLGPSYYRNVARIGLQVAEALAYAHGHGILHRDIKPSNLLINAHGNVWITDFGLCKAEGSGDLTGTGDLIGTLRYMAPERFSGESEVRGDIYGLGITLYELLTLTPAFADADRAELLRKVTQERPRRPRTLDPAIPPDLETIVLKAIAPQPEQRYATADAFARDLQTFLDGRPISARPPSLPYLIRLAIRRNRRASAAIGSAVALLIIATVTYIVVLIGERQEQMRRTYRASIVAVEAAHRVHDIDEARRQLDDAPSRFRGWEWNHLDSRLDQSLSTLRGFPTRIVDLALTPDGRTMAVAQTSGVVLLDLATPERRHVLPTYEGVIAIDISPDGGALAASFSGDAMLRLWRLGHDSGHSRPAVERRIGEHVPQSLCFNAAGDRLAVGLSNYDIVMLDAELGAVGEPLVGHKGVVSAIAFADDDRIISGAWDGEVRVWSLARGKGRTLGAHNGPVRAVDVAPDGNHAATASADRTVKVWDLSSSREMFALLGHADEIDDVAFSPDGERLASASYDRTIKVWDPRSGVETQTLQGHARRVHCISFHPLDGQLFSGSWDGTVKSWDVYATGGELLLREHLKDIWDLEFSDDGRWLASVGRDSAVRVWDTETGQQRRVLLGHERGIYAVVLLSAGTRAISGDAGGVLRLWDVPRGRELKRVEVASEQISDIALSSDGSCVYVTCADGSLQAWDPTLEYQWAVVEAHEQAMEIAISRDDRVLATGGDRGVIRLWSAPGLEPLRELEGHTSIIHGLAFAPDGTLASVSADYDLRLWNPLTGACDAILELESKELEFYHGAPWDVAFDPAGSRIAIASGSGTVRLWDPRHRDQVVGLPGHRKPVSTIAITRDGRRLASACWDGVIRLRDSVNVRRRSESMAQLRTLRVRSDPIVAALTTPGLTHEAVIEALHALEGVDEEVRESALATVYTRLGRPQGLLSLIWRIVVQEHASPREVGQALTVGRALNHSDNANPAYQAAWGAAKYRSDDLPGAADSLDRAIRSLDAAHPRLGAVLAFRAMTSSRLGHEQEARRQLQQLEDLMPRDSGDARLFQEAKRVVTEGPIH